LSPESTPISQKECWNILARRFAEQRELYKKLAHGPKKESYLLFDGAQRNTYISGLKEAYKKTGLRWKGTHAFRHTRATHLTMLGLSEKMQEVVMGHKGMSQQRYIHIVEVLNRRTQEALDLDSIEELT
jgi:integrase